MLLAPCCQAAARPPTRPGHTYHPYAPPPHTQALPHTPPPPSPTRVYVHRVELAGCGGVGVGQQRHPVAARGQRGGPIGGAHGAEGRGQVVQRHGQLHAGGAGSSEGSSQGSGKGRLPCCRAWALHVHIHVCGTKGLRSGARVLLQGTGTGVLAARRGGEVVADTDVHKFQDRHKAGGHVRKDCSRTCHRFAVARLEHGRLPCDKARCASPPVKNVSTWTMLGWLTETLTVSLQHKE